MGTVPSLNISLLISALDQFSSDIFSVLGLLENFGVGFIFCLVQFSWTFLNYFFRKIFFYKVLYYVIISRNIQLANTKVSRKLKKALDQTPSRMRINWFEKKIQY